MGNTSTRDKARHGSGDDAGPTMSTPRRDDEFMFTSGSYDDNNEFPGIFRSDREFQGIRSGPIPCNAGEEDRKLPTVFKWDGGGKNVCISGSFDVWKCKIPMVKSQGDFYTIIELPEGTHEYKFFVDGQWVCNDEEPTIDNNLGSKNNVMTVKTSDFEVFEALALDGLSSGDVSIRDSLSGSPPGDYVQDIPQRGSSHVMYHGGPPVLPPHLLQVILNKEIPLHCEPNLLPEPNHVMLNHLYALSIKEGVIVLSATHRYRKKYVTTLLYKPI